MRSFMKTWIKPGLILFLMVSVSGCMSTLGSKKGETQADKIKERKTTAVYYDFEDILIPKDLKIVEDATVVVKTPGYTSGLLTLKGRVEKISLFNFFANNMIKDNWTMVSQIKSPVSIIMVFKKSSRWAVITIREQSIYTYVEAGVAPTLEAFPSSGTVEEFEKDIFN